MTPTAKAQTVKTLARRVGFDLVGITLADPIPRAAYYRGWLARGYAADMGYLHRNVLVRLEPARLLPGARAIICVALAYKRADGYVRPSQLGAAPAADAARDGPTGRVAQYARGRDYHHVLHGLLNRLVTRVREAVDEPFEARVFVDTGPLLERELAAAAGLGWIGRNTCLLHAQLGSYLLLGEIVTTLDLAPDAPVPQRCGSCTRCIDNCPTGALVAPQQLDARRCIAYLTIEHRGPIAEEWHAPIGDMIFGCDVCQQVCPYNARAPLGAHPDIVAEVTPARLELLPLINLTSGAYRRLTKGSATRRADREMWRRNAAIALGNVLPIGPEAEAALVLACEAEDGGVRAAALAGLRRRVRPETTDGGPCEGKSNVL